MSVSIVEVWVRNPATDRYHRAYRNMDTGVLTTSEACNLDDAKRLEEYPDVGHVTVDQLCKRCGYGGEWEL